MPEFLATISENFSYIIGLGIIGLILLGISIFFFSNYKRKMGVHELLDTVLLLVAVPKEIGEKEEEAKKQEKEIISAAEPMYASLSTLLSQKTPFLFPKTHITFEMAAYGQEIYFYVNTTRKQKDYVEKMVHSQYPKAVIEEVEDYNIFRPDGYSAAMELKLKNSYMVPIKTYLKIETDPLNTLTTALSKLGKNEGAAIQFLIRSTSSSWRTHGVKVAREMQQGKHFTEIGKSSVKAAAKGASKMFEKMYSDVIMTEMDWEREKHRQVMGQPEEEPKRLSPMEEEFVKALEEKANKQGFEVNIRIVTSAQTKEDAEMQMQNIMNAFGGFDAPEFNGFKASRKSRKKVIHDYIFRSFGKKSSMILNTEELTSVFHFPIKTTETPGIRRLEAKQAPAPANLPKEGTPLGANVYRGDEKIVKIKHEDRMRHLYVIGKTGTGKSVLQVNLAIANIKNGDGVCVVDPHGDLIEDILQFVPKERAEDIIIFDPADTERPMGLNMLEFDPKHPEQKDFVVADMIRIFEKLFPPEYIGPMFEHSMRNVMLTLLADKENPGTIVDIPRMFTDETFQKYKVKLVDDPMVRSFWEKEMAKTTDFHKSEMLGYLVSKVGRFVENTMMRNIIGQIKSGFTIRDIMNNKKILLVNLSKGKIGEINSSLLGLIIVSKIQMAAMERASLAKEERKDFFLYIDEFQNFVTDSIATVLSEARKYRLSMCIAHQYIAQLAEKNEQVKNAVFGNVGTMIALRMGAIDAEFMEKEFYPVFDRFDLINVDRFNAYVKLMIDGKSSKPFNIKLFPPPGGGNPKIASIIKEMSRLKFGKPREIVEAEILRRGRLGEASAVITDTELGSLK